MRKTLSFAENMALCNLIVSEYAKSGLDDAQFAKFASERLNLELNHNHIFLRRDNLNIKSKRNSKNKNSNSLKNRIEILEEKVRQLCESLGVK